jgi:hypothetical protein
MLEDPMTRSLPAIAASILAAATLFASTAEAGMKVRLGFGFPLGSFTAHGSSGGSSYSEPRRAKRYHYVRRQENDDVAVTKKAAEAKTVAKADPEPKVEKADDTSQTENSSISTAAIAPVEEPTVEGSTASEPAKSQPTEEKKSVKKDDCKKFFPSVGMTLTVPCE